MTHPLAILARPLVALLMVGAAPAHADTKRFSVTSYERVEVRGDMIVDIVASNSVTARAEGTRTALETLDLVVTNRTLRISQRSTGAYGPRRASDGPLRIRLTAQNLAAVSLDGNGSVTAAGLRGPEILVTLNGPGRIEATVPRGTRVSARADGSGALMLSGRAQSLLAISSGSASVDASALPVRDLDARSSGTGTSRFAASGRARIIAMGAANVEVAGAARCTVTNSGAGTVACGSRQRDSLPTTQDR